MVRFLSVFAVLSAAGVLSAGEVKVTKVHNCCGSCKNAITKALADAGASKVEVKKGEVTFAAEDGDKAVAALFAAGFAGQVEGAKAPAVDGAGVKAKSITIAGVHNCCGSCNGPIQKALKAIEGAKVESKAKQTTVTVSSEKELDVEAVINALRAAGFNGTPAK